MCCIQWGSNPRPQRGPELESGALIQKKTRCLDRGSITGPLDLQSSALPTELSRQFLSIGFGFEFGFGVRVSGFDIRGTSNRRYAYISTSGSIGIICEGVISSHQVVRKVVSPVGIVWGGKIKDYKNKLEPGLELATSRLTAGRADHYTTLGL
jgi:hypothetical protein